MSTMKAQNSQFKDCHIQVENEAVLLKTN